MKQILIAFSMLIATAMAAALQPAEVNIVADPGVIVKPTIRSGNTSTLISVTINKQDALNVNGKRVHPPAPTVGPKPALAPGMVWEQIAVEGGAFASNATVIYGAGPRWTSKPAGRGACSNAYFGIDPAFGTQKSCQAQALIPLPAPPPPNVPDQPTNHHGGLPVDMNGAPVPQPGVATVMLSAPGPVPPLPAPDDWEHDGAFRSVCNWSHMSFDDPIVYPDQPGAAHLHTFFGNNAIDAFTTAGNIRSRGNATCRGGTINLSGYWVPTMIDTVTNKPIAPRTLIIYYKSGMWTYFNDGSQMEALPAGLRMIAGEATRSTPDGVADFSCMVPSLGYDRPGTKGKRIPANCLAGDEIWMRVPFPQCAMRGADGQIVLDSPNHKDHMAYPEFNSSSTWTAARQYRCPASHPVVLPAIAFQVVYALPADPASTAKWRVSSDTYDATLPGGYSAHGDWFSGWDPVISDLFSIECIRKRRDCGAEHIGDGRKMLSFQGNGD